VHVGDFVALAALVELEAYGPLAAVYGNVDEAAVRAGLPERRIVEAEGVRIGLVHDAGPGSRRHERLLRWFPDCDIIAYGHTHLPELSRVGRAWIVNPGSPTERRRAPHHTMAVVTKGEPTLVEL
jgi:uncharacterized protein